MTMMITKFHRLIQNKLLWIAFSVLVVISFVFWQTTGSTPQDQQRVEAPGTMHGKPVPPEVFQSAKFSTYLSFVLQTGQPIPYTADLDERITPLAWRRIAALDLARRLGLTATDQEVVNGLASQSFFQTDGGFDSAKYETFIGQDLSALLQARISKGEFEQHIREEITLNKLRQLVQQTVLVAPQDVETAYHLMNDRYQGVYTVVTPEQVDEQISLSDEEVEAFFQADPEAFQLPEQVRVKYVYFASSNYLAGAEISPARIQAYYDENLEQFQELNTNDVATILGGEGAAEPAAAVTYRPLEDVEEEIREALRAEAARRKAVDEANEMISMLIPDQYGQAPTFEEQATAMGLAVRAMDPFSEYDPLPELAGAAEQFKAQAFRLYPNPEEYFSNPVTTDQGSYVLALEERIPPRVPAFEEVRDRVRIAARAAAVEEAVAARAAEVKAAMEATAGSTNALAQVLEPYGLETTDTDWFTSTNGLDGVYFARDLRSAAIGLNPGEVTDPIPAPTGSVLLMLQDHEPADEAGLVAIREELAAGIRRQYAGGILEDWEEDLLRRAGFRERSFAVADEPDAGADSAAEDPAPTS